MGIDRRSAGWARAVAAVLVGAGAALGASPTGGAGADGNPERSAGDASGETALERFEYRRLAMGCEARLILYAPDEDRARAATRAAFARLSELDRALSDYRDDGPLAALSAAAGGPAVAVPGDLATCAAAALRVAAVSGGAFDPTAAPLTHLWRAARAAGAAPSDGAIDAARALVDWRGLELDPENGTARLARSGMGLDLGGVAKGHAAEVLLELLAGLGVAHALVDVGGDLALGAAPPGRDGWRVLAGAGDGARTLELEQACVATSGPTEQSLEADGVRYSHVLDPRTGRGVTHGRVVTAIVARAPDRPAGAFADALASAASVLSVPAAERVVADFDGARLVVQHPDARSLFDGRSLAGWTTTGGRYDGAAVWSVEDGELVGRTGPGGEGGLLYTEGLYTAFELELEVKLEYPYDSGVFLRMLPPDSGLKGAQVTLDHRPGGEIAGIYADGWLAHNAEAEAQFRRDEWNHVRVRTTGFDFRIEVWLNGDKVTDYTLPAGTPGYAPHGRIGLQVHGADAEAASRAVRFRDLRVRTLPLFGEELFTADGRAAPGVLTPTDAARAGGWRDLLADGLEGFVARGDGDGYALERGILSIPASGGGELASARDFRDFRLTTDFRIAPMANSGLYLRAARGDGNPSYTGGEIQILDDFNWERVTQSTLAPAQFTGSLYGAVAAPPLERKGYRPPGEWNRFEVLYVGPRLAVALNGLTLFDVDTGTLAVEPPFAERAAAGFIGFQRYGADTVEGDVATSVRNLFVQPVEPGEAR